MTQINFRKFITKKEVLAVINEMVNALGISAHIEDAEGKKLIGAEGVCLDKRYAIQLSGEVVGWVVGHEKGSAIATLLSYLVKQEVEKKSLANELLEKYQEIDLLQDISTQITASLDLQEVAQLVIEEAGKLIESTHGSILLLDQRTGLFQTLSEFGETGCPEKTLRLGEGIIGTIVQTGSGEIVNDVSADPRFVDSTERVKSLICVPLKTKEQLIGAITVSSQTSVTYSAGDLKLLTVLALQAAVAIEKALLYEQSRTAAIIAQDHAQQLQSTLDELQQTQAQLIQSEKMSSLGQLVAGVAHEINNPVNFIYGNLSHAHEYTQDLLQLLNLYAQHYPEPAPEIQELAENLDLEFLLEDLPRLLSSMKLGVDRIRSIVSSLRNFSRLEQAEMKPVEIHEGIDSTLLILHHRLKANGSRPEIQVIKEYGELPLVQCYASQLNQVFMNIISNAIDALENQKKPGTITISTERVSEHSQANKHSNPSVGDQLVKDSIVIRIHDNGPGMSEQVRTKLFEPFFTTKPVGKGTGLGLSISYQIVVEKHGGVLKCFSKPGEGTVFWIQIPVTSSVYSSSQVPLSMAASTSA